jgi:dTDP-4-amino-4,6-dideoxygalactose transaminase
MAHLDGRGVESAIVYPRALYDYRCYRDHPGVSLDPCPRAEALAEEVLSLPVRPGLTHLDLGRIVDAVTEALGPRSFRLQPLDGTGDGGGTGSSVVTRVNSPSKS